MTPKEYARCEVDIYSVSTSVWDLKAARVRDADAELARRMMAAHETLQSVIDYCKSKREGR